jgi:hypothetical protein
VKCRHFVRHQSQYLKKGLLFPVLVVILSLQSAQSLKSDHEIGDQPSTSDCMCHEQIQHMPALEMNQLNKSGVATLQYNLPVPDGRTEAKNDPPAQHQAAIL